jgi:hypothetical protein
VGPDRVPCALILSVLGTSSDEVASKEFHSFTPFSLAFFYHCLLHILSAIFAFKHYPCFSFVNTLASLSIPILDVRCT